MTAKELSPECCQSSLGGQLHPAVLRLMTQQSALDQMVDILGAANGPICNCLQQHPLQLLR